MVISRKQIFHDLGSTSPKVECQSNTIEKLEVKVPIKKDIRDLRVSICICLGKFIWGPLFIRKF